MTSVVTSIGVINYKSIANARLKLSSEAILVGPNGSGKSNLLDCFRITSEGLQTTLEHAIRTRGGIKEVRRRSGGHPSHFAISFAIRINNHTSGTFTFRVGAKPNGDFEIQRESVKIGVHGLNQSYYTVQKGSLTEASDDIKVAAKIFPDRFFLTTLSALPIFRGLFDSLSKMSIYNINPALVRENQPPDSGDVLQREGGNIASVIKRLSFEDANALERIEEYLRRIVPGTEGVSYKPLGPQGTLEFRQEIKGASAPWRFYASNMSDGTLRSLGVLTALLQHQQNSNSPSLIGIEEPESTIHPGAAAVIMDAINESSKNNQIIFTTHSPDLLDNDHIQTEDIFGVKNEDGITSFFEVDESAKLAMQNQLLTAGELLRANQLVSNVDKRKALKNIQLDLFSING